MKSNIDKKRLDALLVERGLATSLSQARAMILAGEVHVDRVRADKAGAQFANDAGIEVASRSLKYASRGGLKLEGALADFSTNPAGHVCLDVGSSTGGFTDCLLRHGAARVYPVDVNIAQLDWKLRRDARVIPIKRNARELRREDVPELVDLIVVDISFISATKVLAPAAACAKPGADLLILIKPQFELPREDVGLGGIIRDDALHQKAIDLVKEGATRAGLEILALRPSRLPGAEGNQEFFLHARKRR